MDGCEEETCRVGACLLNWPHRILAKGRPRIDTSGVEDKELDQIARLGDSVFSRTLC